MCLGGVWGGCGRDRRRGGLTSALPGRGCHPTTFQRKRASWRGGSVRGHPMSTPCCRCCPVLGPSRGLAVLLLAALPLVTPWAYLLRVKGRNHADKQDLKSRCLTPRQTGWELKRLEALAALAGQLGDKLPGP